MSNLTICDLRNPNREIKELFKKLIISLIPDTGTHPPLVSSNTNAPYSFNAILQTLNIPLSANLVDNGDGTITFTRGDGSSPVIINLTDDRLNAPMTIGTTIYPIGTTFEVILNALNINAESFAVVATTNLDGSITVTQGGATIFTIPRPFELTLNAGTTDLITDNSLGEATINDGSVLHFWSSNSSLLFDIVQGSAKIDITTRAGIIPNNPVIASPTNIAINSTNLQDTIIELSAIIKTIDEDNCSFTNTQSSDGLTLDFVITHCLTTVPNSIILESLSEDAQNYAWISKTATTITVHYNVAPPVGTNNLTFNGIAFK